MKKGQIEIQFNWIFIFVAGAIILLFFFGVVLKGKGESEQRLTANLLSDIETAIATAKVSRGTAQTISTPEIELEFNCDGCACEYMLGDFSSGFKDNIIFAAERIEGRELITWARDWGMPFRIENFLYLTGKDTKYYFYFPQSGSYVDMIVDMLGEIPEQMNAVVGKDNGIEIGPEEIDPVKALQTGSSLSSSKAEKYRLVFVGDSPSLQNGPIGSQDMRDMEGVTAVEIEIIGRDAAEGVQVPYFETRYYVKDGPIFVQEGSAVYGIGKEALYGAIFSGSPEIFECGMKRAMKRLQRVSGLYAQRTENLKNELAGDRCEFSFYSRQYEFAPKNLVTLADQAKTLDVTSSAARNNLALMAQSVTNIITDNQLLTKDSCPELY